MAWHRRLADNISTEAARRSSKIGGAAHKLAAAARPAQGSAMDKHYE